MVTSMSKLFPFSFTLATNTAGSTQSKWYEGIVSWSDEARK